MAYQIIVKKRFTNKIVKLLNYLETEWGKTAADNFLRRLIEDWIHSPNNR